VILRFPCGRLQPTARERLQGGGMDIDGTLIDLHDVADLDGDWVEAELAMLLRQA